MHRSFVLVFGPLCRHRDTSLRFLALFRPPVLSRVCFLPTEQKLEESRVAAARSKLRAKARSRFLQRREDALMGFEVV